jgi:hypothetical protein
MYIPSAQQAQPPPSCLGLQCASGHPYSGQPHRATAAASKYRNRAPLPRGREAVGTLVRRAVALLARAVAVAVADRVGREPVLVGRLPFLYQVAAYGYG